MTGFMYLILFFLAGVAEAHMDTLQFHFHRSKFSYFKNQQYWNPNIIASYNYGDLKVALTCAIIARVVYGVAFSAFMHILLRD